MEKTWEEFAEVCRMHVARLRETAGAGFCVLAEAGSSPTVEGLRSELLAALPQARWFEFEPTGDDNERAGATSALGRPLRTHLALESAAVILCLEADPLGSHPAAVRYARDFAAGREAATGRMNRLYAVESSVSLTGAAADHRLPLRSSQIPGFVGTLERALAEQGGERSGARGRG